MKIYAAADIHARVPAQGDAPDMLAHEVPVPAVPLLDHFQRRPNPADVGGGSRDPDPLVKDLLVSARRYLRFLVVPAEVGLDPATAGSGGTEAEDRKSSENGQRRVAR